MRNPSTALTRGPPPPSSARAAGNPPRVGGEGDQPKLVEGVAR